MTTGVGTQQAPSARADARLPMAGGIEGVALVTEVRRPQDVSRAVAQARRSGLPVVVVLPGTGHDGLEHANAASVTAYARRQGRPVAVILLKYRNTAQEFLLRAAHATSTGIGILLRVLGELRRTGEQPGAQPVMLVAESQGSQLLANIARHQPAALAAVHRFVAFSPPIESQLREALAGAGLLRTGQARAMLVEHVDDIVTGLFGGMTTARVRSLAQALGGWMQGEGFRYEPHRYEDDGRAAAQFLATGRTIVPGSHASGSHRRHLG